MSIATYLKPNQLHKYSAYPDFFVGLLGIGKSGDRQLHLEGLRSWLHYNTSKPVCDLLYSAVTVYAAFPVTIMTISEEEILAAVTFQTSSSGKRCPQAVISEARTTAIYIP